MGVPVGAADEFHVGDDARDDVCFVDAEALGFPVVAVNYSFADGLFHYGGGVEAIGGEGTAGATFVEEAFFICAMVCHCYVRIWLRMWLRVRVRVRVRELEDVFCWMLRCEVSGNGDGRVAGWQLI